MRSAVPSEPSKTLKKTLRGIWLWLQALLLLLGAMI
jgi:hypothetical protein